MPSGGFGKPSIFPKNRLFCIFKLQFGLMAVSLEGPCRRTWNTLPAKIKNEDDKKKAFGMIKSWIAKGLGKQ